MNKIEKIESFCTQVRRDIVRMVHKFLQDIQVVLLVATNLSRVFIKK